MNVHKQNMHEGAQHHCKQCDQCRHRASLYSNVNVHKQNMHRVSGRGSGGQSPFLKVLTIRPEALKFVTQGGGERS